MSRIHKVNFFFAGIILLVDTLNGFFLFKGINIPVSQGFKLMFTFSMAGGLLLLSNNKFFVWFFLFVFFALFSNIPSLISNPEEIIDSLIFSQKFLFTVLTYFYFTEYFKASNALNFNLIFISNLSVIALNMFFSIIGIGYFAYSNGVGFTGFFFAPNEISFVVLIIFSHLLYEVKVYRPKYLMIIFILFLIMSILLAMKVVILGVFLISLFIFFSGKFAMKKIGLVMFASLFVVFLLFKYSVLFESFINMIVHRYNSSDSLINFVLSGRDNFLIEELNYFLNSSAIFLLFGLGISVTVEMDFFDVLFNYGLIGFIIIYLFFAYVALSFRKKQNNSDSRFLLLVNILIIITSLFVGHFVFSAMGGFFFAYFNAVQRNRINLLSD